MSSYCPAESSISASESPHTVGGTVTDTENVSGWLSKWEVGQKNIC